MNRLKGLGVALVTPMHEDGSIDFVGLKNLLVHTQKGVNYWVVMGTTGENATLSKDEKLSILDFVLANNPKKLPVVWGWGGNNTKQLIEDIKTFDCSGITAFLSVSPYYNKPSQEGIYQHYKALAKASPLPIILYNVPSRTGSNMTAETTLRLAQDSNIIGIKEASSDITQCMDIAAGKPDDFLLISGDDVATIPLMAMGGVGLISVLANAFAQEYSEMITLVAKNEYPSAQKIAFKLQKTFHLAFEEGNPAGIKEMLKNLGICKPFVRLPLVQASENLKQKIQLSLTK
jgi:4-hydroxy-tetrahydrodipicolinate synthase